MNHQKLLHIFRSIQSCPTAPFHEYHVRSKITEFLRDLPHVATFTDSFGNLLATYKNAETDSQLAFGAHMDHPGYVRDPKSGEFTFLGSVPETYRAKNPPRQKFGDFAMWDLPEWELSNEQITSRVCDDLIGCAAIVCLFHELETQQIPTTCHAAFTRAEEVGFLGATHLAKNWPFSANTRFVSLETSAPVPGTTLGEGPVIRVGDRMSVFDPTVSNDLVLAANQAQIPHQRALLDRGSCEATALQHHGIASAGISVLLGNYHNCGTNDQIAAEFVSLGDAKALVKLLVSLVGLVKDGASPASSQLGQRLEKNLEKHRSYIQATQDRFPAH